MTEETTAQAVPKADPETLVLRGAPGRVVRFRRGAVIAIAALGSTAIVGAAWLALKPATFRMAAGHDDRAESSARPPLDALAGAQKSYADVRQPRPPLPGDLGKPLPHRQRPLHMTATPAGPDQPAQAPHADRQPLVDGRTAANTGRAP